MWLQLTLIALIGVPLVIFARRAWLPLLATGCVALALGLYTYLQLRPQTGEKLMAPGGPVPDSLVPSWLPPTTAAIVAVLLAWALRRRNSPVAFVAAASVVLAYVIPGQVTLSVALLAAAALAAYPSGRSYPVFAGGVSLLAVVLSSVADALDQQVYSYDDYPPFSLTLGPLSSWILGLVVTSALAVWAALRRQVLACAVAIGALLATWLIQPGPPGMRFLSQEQYGPEVWSMIFPAALPSLVLLAGAAFVHRQNR